MHRSFLLSLSCLVVMSVGTVLAIQRPAWIEQVLQTESEPAVLVFLVGDARAVAGMREAIADERILVESPRALATVEERIVSADTDAASDILNRAGWVERDVELFTVAPKDWLRPDPASAGSGPGAVDPERLARLRSLVHQPTLTVGEQQLVLQAMSEGLVF